MVFSRARTSFYRHKKRSKNADAGRSVWDSILGYVFVNTTTLIIDMNFWEFEDDHSRGYYLPPKKLSFRPKRFGLLSYIILLSGKFLKVLCMTLSVGIRLVIRAILKLVSGK